MNIPINQGNNVAIQITNMAQCRYTKYMYNTARGLLRLLWPLCKTNWKVNDRTPVDRISRGSRTENFH